MELKWAKAILATAILICLFSIVGNMDLKQQQRGAEWHASVQAIEMEQEKMQNDIIRIREQLLEVEEDIRIQNMLIWDIRDRLHLDLEIDLVRTDY